MLGRLGILTTLPTWITCAISTILKEPAVKLNASFRVQIEMVSRVLVLTILTFSGLGHFLAAAAIRAYAGVCNSVLDVILGMVNWQYASPRPKTVKESP
ncbi:hypothetical protein SAMN04487914_10785 [Arthrobacter sp. ok909]|nr:hypothetical protein SAMN04487914_10785 [Arthrobacter sp. ok909]